MKLDHLLLDRFSGLGTHRQLRPFHTYGPRYLIDQSGRSVLNFASNDYLGLSGLNHSVEVKSQPSSRLLAGNTQEHLDREELLANFLKRPSCLLYPSGYTANMGVLSCLPSKGDLILMDRLCHASLLDGAQLSGARIERFRHLDMKHLEDLLKKHRDAFRCIWVVCESLFSMDGDLCPVRDLVQLKEKYGAFLILDEAHSMGIYGNEGRGWADEQNVLPEVDILTFNLSKAFALQGGVVSGSLKLKEVLVKNSRQQIYTTATPLSHLDALPQRLEALKIATPQREKLKKLSMNMGKALGRKGGWSPILPFHLKGEDHALAIAEELWIKSIFSPAILPPTVPPNTSRLRVSLNAVHEIEDIITLSNALDLGHPKSFFYESESS